jgi:hypothetical protein
MNMTLTKAIGAWLNVSMVGRATGGAPFSPIVGTDINGDGARNDLAFIFDPATTTDPTVASAMDRVLDNVSDDVRACLESQLGQIVRIQARRFDKLLAERQLTLHLSDQAVARIAEAGYDPVYGARPLKRALQKLVIDPLAIKLLAGEFQSGDNLQADVEGETIAFHRLTKGAAA